MTREELYDKILELLNSPDYNYCDKVTLDSDFFKDYFYDNYFDSFNVDERNEFRNKVENILGTKFRPALWYWFYSWRLFTFNNTTIKDVIDSFIITFKIKLD